MEKPYYIEHNNQGELLAVAALWDSWQNQGSREVIRSCCLLTTEANKLMAPIHDRMPVILNAQEQKVWLHAHSNAHELTSILKPYSGTDLHCYPVSKKVNNARYEGIDTIIPLHL